MARLVATSGPPAGRTFEVDSELVIGRTDGDIVVADSEISRRHAAVRPVEGGIEVEDLGSLNGTWVGETRIEAAVTVPDGGVIQVGVTVFTVEARAADHATAAASPTPVVAAPAPAPVAWQSTPAVTRRSQAVASRRWAPTVLSFGTVVLTGIALVLYFGLR
jgi:hypothetical protein